MRDIIKQFALSEKIKTCNGKATFFSFVMDDMDAAKKATAELTDNHMNLDDYIEEMAEENEGRKILGICLVIEIANDTNEIRVCSLSPMAEDEDSIEDIDHNDIYLAPDEIEWLLHEATFDSKPMANTETTACDTIAIETKTGRLQAYIFEENGTKGIRTEFVSNENSNTKPAVCMKMTPDDELSMLIETTE